MSRKPACLTEHDIFATRLRTLMVERGETQDSLAEVIEKQRQTVGTYVTGQSMPKIDVLRKLVEYFNVSADWLLGFTDDRQQIPSAIDELHLSPNAIHRIISQANSSISNKNEVPLEVLSDLIESPLFWSMIDRIAALDKYEEALQAENSMAAFEDEIILAEIFKEKHNTSCIVLAGKTYFDYLEHSAILDAEKLILRTIENRQKKVGEQHGKHQEN